MPVTHNLLCKVAKRIITTTLALPFYLAYPQWLLTGIGAAYIWAVDYRQGC